MLTHAKVLLMAKAHTGAFQSAKAAVRAFGKLGDNIGRANALLVWCAIDLELGYLQEARTTAEGAFAIFDQVGDKDGKQKAFDLSERITSAMGLPTQAELAVQQQRQMDMMRQQQMLMMAQQMQAGGGQLITAPAAAGGNDMP